MLSEIRIIYKFSSSYMRDRYHKLYYKIYLKFEEIIGNQILLFKVVSKLSPMHKYLIDNYFFY